MYPGPHMDMSAMWFAGMLWWVVAIAAVIAGAWLIGTLLRSGRDARKLLDERLARGDIDIEDYRARAALIDGAPVGR